MTRRRFRLRWVLAAGVLAVIAGVVVWLLVSPGGRSPGKAAASGGPGDGHSCSPRPQPSPGPMSQYDRQVMSLRPAAYLPLSRAAAGVEPDLTGHGHNGAYRGAGSPGTARLPNGDRAVTFDGHGQYVEVPSAAALSITDTGCLTVQAWVRPDVLEFPVTEGTGYAYILGKGEVAKQEYALRMYSLTNSEVPPRPNRISAYVFNRQGGLGSGAYFQDKVTPGQWVMLTFVVDSRPSARWPEGCISIYKNGELRGSPVGLNQFHVTPQASDAPFRIGTRDLESYFDGAIAKVAVYDSVLSSQDIAQTYEAMIHPTS
jgi:Concanavalin A-like lectin/glucanases superfamily